MTNGSTLEDLYQRIEQLDNTANGSGVRLIVDESLPSGWAASHVIMLSISILVFGLVCFGIMAWLARRSFEAAGAARAPRGGAPPRPLWGDPGRDQPSRRRTDCGTALA